MHDKFGGPYLVILGAVSTWICRNRSALALGHLAIGSGSSTSASWRAPERVEADTKWPQIGRGHQGIWGRKNERLCNVKDLSSVALMSWVLVAHYMPMKFLLIWASKASRLRKCLRAFRPFCSQSFVWTFVLVFNSTTFYIAQRHAFRNWLETPGDLVANMLNKCNIGMNATASLGQWPRKDVSDRFTPAERKVAHNMQESSTFASALALDSQLESSSVGSFNCTGFLCARFSLFNSLSSFGLLNLLKCSFHTWRNDKICTRSSSLCKGIKSVRYNMSFGQLFQIAPSGTTFRCFKHFYWY